MSSSISSSNSGNAVTLLTGLHYDVPAHVYHADPCASPSLSQSVAKRIVTKSARHGWTMHPRLNPMARVISEADQSPDWDRDVGTAAHTLLLGRGRAFSIVQADDWRTRGAKEARDEAFAEEKMPILVEQYDIANMMVDVADQFISDAGFYEDWKDGNAEVVAIADVDGITLRGLIDWVPRNHARVWDYKTGGVSCAPDDLPKKLASGTWDIQGATHERILNALYPEDAGRRKHMFLAQENYEPFACSLCELTEATMTMGRAQLDRAIAIWRDCMASGKWPAYPTVVQRPEYPAWKMAAVMEEQTDDRN